MLLDDGNDLPNAIALNNAAISSGRMIGPVTSGVLIAAFGMAPSFFINAVSFGLVVLVLLARRLAVYLESGSRSRMIVTFEGIDKSEGRERAKFYIDWKIDGMRNRQLFTKIRMAGDVFFDLGMKRFTMVDLAGQFGVQGAIVTKGQAPEIIQAEGKVSYKSTLVEVPVAAAASSMREAPAPLGLSPT